jgi:putative heme-binding domain-containing protein
LLTIVSCVWFVPDACAQTPEWSLARVRHLAANALEFGNAERGLTAFGSSKTACISCHRIGRHGGTVGPDLSKIGRERTPEEIVESILWPTRKVEDQFRTIRLLTADGLLVKGYRVKSIAGHIAVRDPATAQVTQVAETDVEELVSGGTLMPDALAAALTAQQLNDVVMLLSRLGRNDAPESQLVEMVLSHSLNHTPASFHCDLRPLRPAIFPHHDHHVNRDRIYDFYTKQAEHFRQADFRPLLLAQYPGLDGGTLGHWGNQNEQTWANDDWNNTDHGRLLSGVTRGHGVTVTRGICVRLGDNMEVSACFDPETLT